MNIHSSRHIFTSPRRRNGLFSFKTPGVGSPWSWGDPFAGASGRPLSTHSRWDVILEEEFSCEKMGDL